MYWGCYNNYYNPCSYYGGYGGYGSYSSYGYGYGYGLYGGGYPSYYNQNGGFNLPGRY